MRKAALAPAVNSAGPQESHPRRMSRSHAPVQADPVLNAALRLLSYRWRSEKEMTERLRMKGFGDPAINGVILRLKSGGFLDDRRLASSLKTYAGESKHLGILGIRRFLAGRGVPRDIIKEVTGDIEEEESARRLVEKKLATWRRESSSGLHAQLTPGMIRKLYGILSRRGYLAETIRRTLKQFTDKEVV